MSAEDEPSPVLRSAFNLLVELLPPEELALYSLRHSPATVYNTLCTLLILTLQRMGGGQSLQKVVREVLAQYRHLLPENKRVRQGTLSSNPSGFSKARQRLSVAQSEQFCDSVAQTLIARGSAPAGQRAIYVIDGTTIALSPSSELTQVYPPAVNQFGQSVWPIMLITLAHELYSGVALRPEFGPQFGKDPSSEAQQIEQLAQRIPRDSLLLADSGYGIFRVCYRCHREAKQQFLFRLTHARFQAMKRQAMKRQTQRLGDDQGIEHYELHWRPSAKDRRGNPELPSEAQLPVHLYSSILPNGEPLHLVSSMNLDPQAAVDLYALRYTAIEHDIRDLKCTLNLEKMSAQSEAMVQKEILCSMVAYNLVVQFRRDAAARAKLLPRRISFKRCYETVQVYLLAYGSHPLEQWLARYEQAVQLASKDILPIRPGRSFPRRAHPKRSKSSKTQHHKKTQTSTPPPTTPPPDG